MLSSELLDSVLGKPTSLALLLYTVVVPAKIGGVTPYFVRRVGSTEIRRWFDGEKGEKDIVKECKSFGLLVKMM